MTTIKLEQDAVFHNNKPICLFDKKNNKIVIIQKYFKSYRKEAIKKFNCNFFILV